MHQDTVSCHEKIRKHARTPGVAVAGGATSPTSVDLNRFPIQVQSSCEFQGVFGAPIPGPFKEGGFRLLQRWRQESKCFLYQAMVCGI